VLIESDAISRGGWRQMRQHPAHADSASGYGFTSWATCTIWLGGGGPPTVAVLQSEKVTR